MRRLAALLIILLLIAGCPQEEERYEYSVDSLAIESRDHIFSENYKIFVKLSENSFTPGNSLVLYQGGARILDHPLSEEAPEGRELVFGWTAASVGEHELRTVLLDVNGTEVSDAKALSVSVVPNGFYDIGADEPNHPVETGVWCAQEITLGTSVPVSEISLHLRSPVATRAGKTVSVELVNEADGLPGTEATAAASLPSTDVPARGDWVSFDFGRTEVPAGSYWLLLKRDDTMGIISWTYSDEEEADGAYCRDLTVSDEWFPINGRFAHKIQ
ncbi:MAG: hypothetical protein GY852_10660 [bacterium]|nr:hypothetical protein [bacterium]